MKTDYWILASVAVIGIGSSLFLLREAKRLRRQAVFSTTSKEMNLASQKMFEANNRQVMEELHRQIIAVMQENPGAAEERLGQSGMTASQVQMLLAQPITPLSAGSLIQLALALQLPVRIVLDVPVQLNTDTTRVPTAKNSDVHAIDNL